MNNTIKPTRVLIVEDNVGDIFLVEKFLKKRFDNLSIDIANTFKKAKTQILACSDYDVILLDLKLPDLSEHKLVDEVLDICNCSVIILTGYSDLKVAKEVLAKGVADFLIKDEISPEALHKSVLYAIERKRFIDDLRATKENYRNLFHLSPQPKWIYELSTFKILDANTAALKQYGYSLEEFIGKQIHELRPPEHIPTLQKVIKRPLSERQTPYNGTFVHRKKDGQIITVDIYSRDILFQNIPSRMIVAIDISERKRLQEELQLTSYNVEKRERERMATSLHNGLQQMLLASFMSIEALGKEVEKKLDSRSKSSYEKGLSLLQEAIETTRRIAHEITPFEIEEKGLTAGIETILERHSQSNLTFNFINDLKSNRLPTNLEIILFRTTQEIINNIVKHAKASTADITLTEKDKELMLDISDNGVGFDPSLVGKKHLGLKALSSSIDSVNGHLHIDSQLGKGTKIEVRIPVPY